MRTGLFLSARLCQSVASPLDARLRRGRDFRWRSRSGALQVPTPYPQGRPSLPCPTCGAAQGTIVLLAVSLHVPPTCSRGRLRLLAASRHCPRGRPRLFPPPPFPRAVPGGSPRVLPRPRPRGRRRLLPPHRPARGGPRGPRPACWAPGVVASIWCGSLLEKFRGWARRLERGVRRNHLVLGQREGEFAARAPELKGSKHSVTQSDNAECRWEQGRGRPFSNGICSCEKGSVRSCGGLGALNVNRNWRGESPEVMAGSESACVLPEVGWCWCPCSF